MTCDRSFPGGQYNRVEYSVMKCNIIYHAIVYTKVGNQKTWIFFRRMPKVKFTQLKRKGKPYLPKHHIITKDGDCSPLLVNICTVYIYICYIYIIYICFFLYMHFLQYHLTITTVYIYTAHHCHHLLHFQRPTLVATSAGNIPEGTKSWSRKMDPCRNVCKDCQKRRYFSKLFL